MSGGLLRAEAAHWHGDLPLRLGVLRPRPRRDHQMCRRAGTCFLSMGGLYALSPSRSGGAKSSQSIAEAGARHMGAPPEGRPRHCAITHKGNGCLPISVIGLLEASVSHAAIAGFTILVRAKESQNTKKLFRCALHWLPVRQKRATRGWDREHCTPRGGALPLASQNPYGRRRHHQIPVVAPRSPFYAFSWQLWLALVLTTVFVGVILWLFETLVKVCRPAGRAGGNRHRGPRQAAVHGQPGCLVTRLQVTPSHAAATLVWRLVLQPTGHLCAD